MTSKSIKSYWLKIKPIKTLPPNIIRRSYKNTSNDQYPPTYPRIKSKFHFARLKMICHFTKLSLVRALFLKAFQRKEDTLTPKFSQYRIYLFLYGCSLGKWSVHWFCRKNSIVFAISTRILIQLVHFLPAKKTPSKKFFQFKYLNSLIHLISKNEELSFLIPAFFTLKFFFCKDKSNKLPNFSLKIKTHSIVK